MQPAARPFKAIVWMIGALASFATMTVSIRELTGEMHAFQMLFIRSVIGIAILLPVIARSRRGWGQIGRRYLPGHLLRNVIHFTGQVLWIFRSEARRVGNEWCSTFRSRWSPSH